MSQEEEPGVRRTEETGQNKTTLSGSEKPSKEPQSSWRPSRVLTYFGGGARGRGQQGVRLPLILIAHTESEWLFHGDPKLLERRRKRSQGALVSQISSCIFQRSSGTNASFNRWRSQIPGGRIELLVHKSTCLMQIANRHISEMWFNSLTNEEGIRFKTVPEARYAKAISWPAWLQVIYKWLTFLHRIINYNI